MQIGGLAIGDEGTTGSQFGGDIFWYRENINSGFDEGIFLIPILDTDTFSISIGDTGRGREGSNCPWWWSKCGSYSRGHR